MVVLLCTPMWFVSIFTSLYSEVIDSDIHVVVQVCTAR